MEDKKDKFVSFIIDDIKYKTTLTKKVKEQPKWTKPDARQVFPFIPGTITKVIVEEGKKVKKGQKVLILEAMKMMNQVTAPFDGVIKTIHVKIGQNVSKSTILFELE